MGGIHTFPFQQRDLFGNAPGIPREASVGADNTVAGDNDGNGVMSYSTAHCLTGHTLFAHGGCQLASDFTIGDAMAVGDSAQYFPYRLPEWAALGRKGNIRYGGPFPRKVGVQPCSGQSQDGRIRFFLKVVMHCGRIIFLPFQPQSHNVARIAGQGQFAQRGQIVG